MTCAGPPGRLYEFRFSVKQKQEQLSIASTLFAEACEFEDKGESETALALYDRVLEHNPNYAAAWVNKGVIFDKRRDFQTAEACFRAATEIDPNYVIALYDLGCVLDSRDKRTEAIEVSLRAIAINPCYADAHHNLAHYYSRSANGNERALHHWKIFVGLKPNDGWWTMRANMEIARLSPLPPPKPKLVVIPKPTRVRANSPSRSTEAYRSNFARPTVGEILIVKKTPGLKSLISRSRAVPVSLVPGDYVRIFWTGRRNKCSPSKAVFDCPRGGKDRFLLQDGRSFALRNLRHHTKIEILSLVLCE